MEIDLKIPLDDIAVALLSLEKEHKIKKYFPE